MDELAKKRLRRETLKTLEGSLEGSMENEKARLERTMEGEPSNAFYLAVASVEKRREEFAASGGEEANLDESVDMADIYDTAAHELKETLTEGQLHELIEYGIESYVGLARDWGIVE